MFLKRHFKATLIKISFRAYFCIETLRQCGKEMLSICVKFLFPTHLEIVFSNGFWASLVAQRLRRLPPMRETWVWSLGREDPLQEGIATLSSILARRIPWREKPGRLLSTGSQRVRHNWVTSLQWILGAMQNFTVLTRWLIYRKWFFEILDSRR